MAVVKSAKRLGRVAGRVLDAEDRALIGQGIALTVGAGFAAVAVAAILGLAWRAFLLAAGG